MMEDTMKYKCDCVNCKPHPLKQKGVVVTHVMIGNPNEMPIHAATIQIECMPFLIEDWMLEKVIVTASKQLASLVLHNSDDKVQH